MAWFVDLLEAALGAVEWKASRVDLFVDTQGWSLGSEDRGRFVCRAKKLVTHEDGESLTGFQFGSRKSGALTARIYDKTVEVADKGSDWWFAKWGDSFQPGERVLRVEFEVNRPALKEMKLDAPSAVLESAPAIWGYVTDDWLTYRTPAADGTRSRWPVAPEWRDIQRASLRGGALGLDRVQAGVAQGSLRNMLPALRGYLVSAGAHLGVSTLEETLHRVGRVLSLDEQRTGIPFSDRIAERRLGWVAS
jgi:hypothetical protein